MGHHHTTLETGQRAEQLALRYLCERGLQRVAMNFRSRGGEIDLIMLDADCLVFVEVRFRSSGSFVAASHTVDSHKQRKLIRTAALFIARNQQFAMHTMRFDVIAIEGREKTALTWLKDAFRPNNSTL